MTTVLMVSGSWPPDVCGVGDYTEVLCRHLEAAGLSIVRYDNPRFSSLCSRQILGEIDAADCDIIHIQYPTTGFGRSLTPSMIARRTRDKPVVVTLHEYSVFRPYRRAWFTPYAQFCAARIFTTPFERDLFAARFPKRNGTDVVIEIASNVPIGNARERATDKIVYFGLIAPQKGIEAFLEFSAIAKAQAGGFAVELIGAAPRQHQKYAEDIVARARAAGVEVALNLPSEQVADRLSAAVFAYLPFPDGASAKRGSLAAALVNGVVVATRHSALTPDWLRSATIPAETPQSAFRALANLRRDDAARSEFKQRTEVSAGRFHWGTTARRHVELYDRILSLGAAAHDVGAPRSRWRQSATEIAGAARR